MLKKFKGKNNLKLKGKKPKSPKSLKALKLPKLPKLPKLQGKKKSQTGAKGKNIKKAMSLQYKLIGSLVIFAAVPVIIVSILSGQANMKAIENTVGSYSQSMVEQFGHSFNNIIDQTRNTLTQYMLMGDIQTFTLQAEEDNAYEEYRKLMVVNEELQKLVNGNHLLSGVMVVTSDDGLYFKDRYDGIKNEVESIQGSDFLQSGIVNKMREETGPAWFYSLTESTKGVYLGWNYNAYNSNKEGVMVAAVDKKQIQELIDIVSIEGVSNFYIADGNRNIVIGPNEEDTGMVLDVAYVENVFGERKSHTFVEGDKLVSFYTLKNGWKAIYDAPLSVLMADVTKAKNNSIIIAIVCILLAIVIGFIITISILRPINRLSGVMAEAETGNLAVEYKYNFDNEIGRLVRSFNQMIHNIKDLVQDTTTVAETIEVSTEKLQVVSESTARSSNQITQAIESIATGTESQTVQIVNSTQMMENLSENINIATQKVQTVQEVANNTMKVSNDTVSTMEELTAQSEQTIKISTEIETHIEELGDEASKITNVIGMIQSISEQTNLLALNATIEAARAGEAGLGFGVVADEIRKLANQSKDATARIEEIIISIMNKKDTSIKGAREATSLIARQRPIVDNTNKAFERINEEMERVVTQLDELHELFGAITSHKDDAVVSISEISDIIGHSASAAEEVFATSAEQSTSAERIEEMANGLLKGVEELKRAQEKFRL